MSRFINFFETKINKTKIVNIISGNHDELGKVLSEHNGVDAIWCFGEKAHFKSIEALSISNLKQTLTFEGKRIDWNNPKSPVLKEILRKSVQVKNIWIPYGE